MLQNKYGVSIVDADGLVLSTRESAYTMLTNNLLHNQNVLVV